MSRLVARLRRRMLAIDPGEVRLDRRGFPCRDEAVRQRLEGIGGTFVDGYHAGLEQSGEALGRHLDGMVAGAELGWAYEGAAMALAIRDWLTPWGGRRFERFLAGPGRPHRYLVLVGGGWAMARLPHRVRRAVRRLGGEHDLGWLLLDGWGFHDGFFRPGRTVAGQRLPRGVPRGYARRAYSQGVGRSLWFVRGIDPPAIIATVQAFEADRGNDLWSGVGLACGYAGGVDAEGIRALMAAAGDDLPAFAQGVAFASKARQEADNLTPLTELACQTVWQRSSQAVAAVTDECRDSLAAAGAGSRGEPRFELWRRSIQERFIQDRSIQGRSTPGRPTLDRSIEDRSTPGRSRRQRPQPEQVESAGGAS